MLPSRPYLLRATYEWIADSDLTPYVLVNVTDDTEVPKEHVKNGQIVLNISMVATQNLSLGNEAVAFDARFSGINKHLYLPIRAIAAIYAKENGRGMVFTNEDIEGDAGESHQSQTTPSTPPKNRGKPNLKLVE